VDRAEFFALPLALRVRVLFDALDEDAARFIAEAKAPAVPRSPKYDQAIYRSSGIMFASEVDLSGLLYWAKKYEQDVARGGEYVQQNTKRLDTLKRWIAWRECFPDAIWIGKRNDVDVVAKPPSSNPPVYPKPGGQRVPRPDPSDDIDPDASIPF
jgi:hypothetical protein